MNVEVADGFTDPVNAVGECQLHLEDQNGVPFTVIMNKVLYVPGLRRDYSPYLHFPIKEILQILEMDSSLCPSKEGKSDV